MKKKITILVTMLLALTLGVSAVAGNYEDKTKADKEARKSGVTTKEQQTAMTPQAALERLKRGNAQFAARGENENKRYRKQVKFTAQGQYPYAAIVSCLDSRVSVEEIFDLNNGDAFNARIAGNIVNPDILGSLEFATKVSGAKVVMVLGHTKCGAVKGACDGVELGNLTGLLDRIEPAVKRANPAETNRTSKNGAFVEIVGEENVRLVMENIKKDSPILAEMINSGQVMLIGGVYDLETGNVRFLN